MTWFFSRNYKGHKKRDTPQCPFSVFLQIPPNNKSGGRFLAPTHPVSIWLKTACQDTVQNQTVIQVALILVYLLSASPILPVHRTSKRGEFCSFLHFVLNPLLLRANSFRSLFLQRRKKNRCQFGSFHTFSDVVVNAYALTYFNSSACLNHLSAERFLKRLLITPFQVVINTCRARPWKATLYIYKTKDS